MATYSVERLGRMWRTQKNLRVIAKNSRRSWPSAAPVWPLPRQAGGPCDEEIRAEFAKYPLWHYAYRFEGGLDFAVRHSLRAHTASSPAPERRDVCVRLWSPHADHPITDRPARRNSTGCKTALNFLSFGKSTPP
jgi:hypothetical protein